MASHLHVDRKQRDRCRHVDRCSVNIIAVKFKSLPGAEGIFMLILILWFPVVSVTLSHMFEKCRETYQDLKILGQGFGLLKGFCKDLKSRILPTTST